MKIKILNKEHVFNITTVTFTEIPREGNTESDTFYVEKRGAATQNAKENALQS